MEVQNQCFLCEFCNLCFHQESRLLKHRNNMHLNCKISKIGTTNVDGLIKDPKEMLTREARIHLHRVDEDRIIPKALREKICIQSTFITNTTIKADSVFRGDDELTQDTRRKQLGSEDRPFNCQYCLKTFPKTQNLRAHEKLLCVSSQPSKNCDTAINQREGDLNPQMIQEDSNFSNTIDHPEADAAMFENTEPPEYKEEDDENIVKGSEVHGLNAPELSSQSADDKERESKYTQGKSNGRTLLKYFSCEYCNKKFPTKSKLEMHIRTHTNEKPYKCQYCNVKFKIKTNANKHTKAVHIKYQKYNCMYCTKSFTMKGDLVQHERRHRSEKPHSCRTCDKTFVTASDRNKHEIKHSNAKPFECNFCDQTFKWKKSLSYHILSIHTNERPHQCSLCSKTFVKLSKLKSHQGTHESEKNYKCKFCDSRYKYVWDKTRHEKTHTEPLVVYNCTFCTKIFNWKSNWKKHIQTHTKEKPFKCEVCGKTFTTDTILKAHHRKIHTG